ncbi:MAG TPA: molybdate ABC transporter permease subunit [Chthonomonadaceae bacterium]|nr:molybdate ABC transporter permease subunit [Chthonomonadaceae bacterium]
MSGPIDWSPLFVSLRVAVCATLLSCVIGIPLAYLLARRRLPGRALWEGVVLLPLVLPPTVLGYYLLVALAKTSPLGHAFHVITRTDLAFTWQGAAVAASLVSLPLLVRTLQAAFADVAPELLDAARTEGATDLQTFLRIQLPLARRGLVAGVGLAFARALGDFGATLMIGGNIPGETRTLPLAVYDAVNSGEDRTALIFVLLLSGVCLLFALLASAFTPHHKH